MVEPVVEAFHCQPCRDATVDEFAHRVTKNGNVDDLPTVGIDEMRSPAQVLSNRVQLVHEHCAIGSKYARRFSEYVANTLDMLEHQVDDDRVDRLIRNRPDG